MFDDIMACSLFFMLAKKVVPAPFSEETTQIYT